MFSTAKLLIIALMALILSPSIIYAQAPDTIWTRSYELSGHQLECWDAVESNDGGIVVAGAAVIQGYMTYLYVINIDTNGDTVWTAKYDDGSIGRAVCNSHNNGYVVAGYRIWNGLYPYLTEIDQDGNTVWSQTHNYWNSAQYRSIEPVGDDGYIAAGFIENGPYGMGDFLLVRISNDGDTLWSRVYGSSVSEKAWSVKPTSDNGFVVAGWSESFSNGLADIYIIKTDVNGDSVWTRNYGGPINDEAREVYETSDGGFVISGKRTEPDSSPVYYLMKVDSAGDSVWAHYYQATNPMHNVIHSFTPTDDGGFALIGYGDAVVVYKTNSEGDSLWYMLANEFPNVNHKGHCIIQTQDRSLVLCGYNTFNIWATKLVAEPLGIDENKSPQIPVSAILNYNYPNPFNASTTISYSLPYAHNISLIIFDLLGREIETLEDGFKEAGDYSVLYNAENLSSGVYFYRLETESGLHTKSMTILK